MSPYLKSTFRKEELELAASIGQQGTSLQARIEALFRGLSDPLLSAADVKELLAVGDFEADIEAALSACRTAEVLESSDSTLRPRDSEGLVLYRLKDHPVSRLRIIAAESVLSNGSSRFQFTCDGRLIRSIAKVDRLDALADTGQQRDEIGKHVEEIAKGISDGTQVPNSLLVAFAEGQIGEDPGDGSAPKSFVLVHPLQEFAKIQHPANPNATIQQVRLVELDIPYRNAAFDEEKPAFLVDGQQRTAALASVDIDDTPEFALSVNAVIVDEEGAKRVFQVANSTVRISVQFARALTASLTDTPGYLREEAAVAKATKQLALHLENSPFKGLVQHPGVRQQPKPAIVYNSLFHVVRLFHDAGLPFTTTDQLAGVVAKGFRLVRETWPKAWGQKPEKSRLMHGVGLRCMGALIASKLEAAVQAEDYDLDLLSDKTWQNIGRSMARLQNHIVWTAEEASEATKNAANFYLKKLMTAQNTNQDIAEVTSQVKMMSTQLDLDAKRKMPKAK